MDVCHFRLLEKHDQHLQINTQCTSMPVKIQISAPFLQTFLCDVDLRASMCTCMQLSTRHLDMQCIRIRIHTNLIQFPRTTSRRGSYGRPHWVSWLPQSPINRATARRRALHRADMLNFMQRRSPVFESNLCFRIDTTIFIALELSVFFHHIPGVPFRPKITSLWRNLAGQAYHNPQPKWKAPGT